LQGELVGNRIVLWDIAQARQAFREGFYGKPLGIPKPKNTEFNAYIWNKFERRRSRESRIVEQIRS